MIEIIVLFLFGLLWILGASIQDLRTREVANWLNFSLIIFVIGFRFFYSLFGAGGEFMFFYQGVIGLAIFYLLGHLFYYARLFAGGDAKLMIALGPILAVSTDFFTNLQIFTVFFLVFLGVGAAYGLAWSVYLMVRNFSNFKQKFKEYALIFRKPALGVMGLGLVLMLLGFINGFLLWLGIIVFIFPYFFLYAKAVDEGCMIKKVKTSKLTVGDWLYKEIKIGSKKIKPTWGGLGGGDIHLIKKKYKIVEIKQGIPFVPVFLISFIILGAVYFSGYLDKILFFLSYSLW